MTLNRFSRRIRRRPQIELLEGRTLLAAGALDTTFGGTGQVITDLTYNFSPKGLAVQSNLETVVVGIESPSNSTGKYPWSLALVRYNVNGSLDSTFGSGGEVVLATNTLSPRRGSHSTSTPSRSSPTVRSWSQPTPRPRTAGGSHLVQHAGLAVQHEREPRHVVRSRTARPRSPLPRGWPSPAASRSCRAVRS